MTATGYTSEAASALPRAATVPGTETITVNRPATGPEGLDVWQAQYAGQRGMYANGYGCARARVPNHPDAADQYAFRSQCHPTKNGTAQPIGSFALSDNTDMFVTLANGDSYATRDLYAAGRKVSAPAAGVTLSALNGLTNPVPTPGKCRLKDAGSTVELGGRITNQTAGTIASGTVLFQLGTGFKPPNQIKLQVRYTGGGNTLTIEINGDVSIGTPLTAGQEVFLDGLTFVKDWS